MPFTDAGECWDKSKIIYGGGGNRVNSEHEVNPIVGSIALSALRHQAHIHLDEDDKEFVDKLTNILHEDINEAEADQYSRLDGAIH
jgi:hypothetical protein